jgi:predicted short-subunit dehydrogenase-like oxidoreductase (DUF2520 family)
VNDTTGRACALVGPGRAGTAVALALVETGRRVVTVAGRRTDAPSTRAAAERFIARAVAVDDAGRDADLVVIATPDAAIESTAAAVAPGLRPGALVVHLSGARGLDALAPIAESRPDVRIGALHPLQTFPPADAAARDALGGAWAAVAGPAAVDELARELGLRPFRVDDAHRARYHAAACVASNHVVALLGQVERLASAAGVPFEAFVPLVRASVDNAFASGPAAALTGPVARGDVATVAAHLDAIGSDEQSSYRGLAVEAHRLSARDDAELRALLEVQP